MAIWKTNRQTKKPFFSGVPKGHPSTQTLQEFSDAERNRVLREYWERRVSQLPPSFRGIQFEGFVHDYSPGSLLDKKWAGLTLISPDWVDEDPRMQINFEKGVDAVEYIIEHEVGHVIWNRLKNNSDPKAKAFLEMWHKFVTYLHRKYPKSKRGYYGDEEELFCEMFATYRFPVSTVWGKQEKKIKREDPSVWEHMRRFTELLGTSLEGRDITMEDIAEL